VSKLNRIIVGDLKLYYKPTKNNKYADLKYTINIKTGEKRLWTN